LLHGGVQARGQRICPATVNVPGKGGGVGGGEVEPRRLVQVEIRGARVWLRRVQGCMWYNVCDVPRNPS